MSETERMEERQEEERKVRKKKNPGQIERKRQEYDGTMVRWLRCSNAATSDIRQENHKKTIILMFLVGKQRLPYAPIPPNSISQY